MNFWVLIGLGLSVAYGAIVVVGARTQRVVDSAFRAGRREGLRKAREIARTRSEIAFQTAPAGKIMVGATRAAMADQIEEDILAELETK